MNEIEKLGQSQVQLTRFVGIMKRHIRSEHAALSDRDFIEAVYLRYRKYLQEPIIDCNE